MTRKPLAPTGLGTSGVRISRPAPAGRVGWNRGTGGHAGGAGPGWARHRRPPVPPPLVSPPSASQPASAPASAGAAAVAASGWALPGPSGPGTAGLLITRPTTTRTPPHPTPPPTRPAPAPTRTISTLTRPVPPPARPAAAPARPSSPVGPALGGAGTVEAGLPGLGRLPAPGSGLAPGLGKLLAPGSGLAPGHLTPTHLAPGHLEAYLPLPYAERQWGDGTYPPLYAPVTARIDEALGQVVNDRLVAWAREVGIYADQLDKFRGAGLRPARDAHSRRHRRPGQAARGRADERRVVGRGRLLRRRDVTRRHANGAAAAPGARDVRHGPAAAGRAVHRPA